MVVRIIVCEVGDEDDEDDVVRYGQCVYRLEAIVDPEIIFKVREMRRVIWTRDRYMQSFRLDCSTNVH